MSNDQGNFIDVEDDEQRQNRIGGLLARLNNSSSSTLVSSSPVLNIGHERPGPTEPPTELLTRIQAFLPAISASNEALSKMDPEDIDIENIQEDGEQYIALNLGLGVFEGKPTANAGTRSISPSSEADSESESGSGSGSGSESESESESESSRWSAEEDSESTSSSDDDSDSSESQSGSSVNMKPVFSRPIKPLPRRVSENATIQV